MGVIFESSVGVKTNFPKVKSWETQQKVQMIVTKVITIKTDRILIKTIGWVKCGEWKKS